MLTCPQGDNPVGYFARPYELGVHEQFHGLFSKSPVSPGSKATMAIMSVPHVMQKDP